MIKWTFLIHIRSDPPPGRCSESVGSASGPALGSRKCPQSPSSCRWWRPRCPVCGERVWSSAQGEVTTRYTTAREMCIVLRFCAVILLLNITIKFWWAYSGLTIFKRGAFKSFINVKFASPSVLLVWPAPPFPAWSSQRSDWQSRCFPGMAGGGRERRRGSREKERGSGWGGKARKEVGKERKMKRRYQKGKT